VASSNWITQIEVIFDSSKLPKTRIGKSSLERGGLRKNVSKFLHEKKQKLGQTHQNYFRNAEQEYFLFDQHLEVLLWDYQGDRLEF
jgi:hypothetical protein